MQKFNFSPAALAMNERILEMRRQDRLTSMDERLLPALRKFSNSTPKIVPDAIKNTLDDCTKAAEQGDVEAMFILGLTYFFGKAMRYSPVGALEHYLLCFMDGKDTSSERSKDADDVLKAVQYFEAAANCDYDHAEYQLYTHYLLEYSIAREKALNYCTRAANKGLASAQDSLAIHYQYGTVVDRQRPELAFLWCEKAAAHDFYYPGQHRLAEYHEDGIGTHIDVQKSQRLYDLAKKNGYTNDSNFR